MIAATQPSWQEANKDYLVRALAPVRRALEAAEEGKAPMDAEARRRIDGELATLAAEMPAPPTLELLCQLFGLSTFERDVLLLAAGIELDSGLASLVPAGGPSFGLALSRLADPHWSALSPTAPLRRWRLLEVISGDTLAGGRLKADERILHYLVGVDTLDERLFGLVEPVAQRPGALAPSHQTVADEIAGWWRTQGSGGWPAVELVGRDAAAQSAVAASAGAAIGLRVTRCRVRDLPTAAAERDALAVLLQREAALSGLALLVDARGLEAGSAQARAGEALLETLTCRLAVAGNEGALSIERPCRRREVDAPRRHEQRGLWEQALGGVATELDEAIDRTVAHYRLDTATLADAAASALAAPAGERPDALWNACRRRTRGRLDALAQRIRPRAVWDELVLPELQLELLRAAAAQLRHRHRVYDDWGFAARSDRGLGISALFAGPSGTGKTMAAEVLANELELDLYRIDLSQVVSKYIGETEKNLRRVFDAAESSGALLLFDEADALFGKRSEVKDSHDRYANIEVSYLLQRMEAYRGVSVLTTNLKDAIDKAFLRRIRFIIQFPFPDAELRGRIWEGIFPPTTPTDALDTARLAQLNVAGGSIHNIAMNAAFLAAERDGAVDHSDILRAARHEYAKADKTISERERRGLA